MFKTRGLTVQLYFYWSPKFSHSLKGRINMLYEKTFNLTSMDFLITALSSWKDRKISYLKYCYINQNPVLFCFFGGFFWGGGLRGERAWGGPIPSPGNLIKNRVLQQNLEFGNSFPILETWVAGPLDLGTPLTLNQTPTPKSSEVWIWHYIFNFNVQYNLSKSALTNPSTSVNGHFFVVPLWSFLQKLIIPI